MRLEIICHDRVGIAQDVLSIFVERKIDLRGIELKQPGHIFINIPDLEFREYVDSLANECSVRITIICFDLDDADQVG